MDEHRVDVDGVTIRYFVVGDGDRPLLLLHGWPESARAYGSVVPLLSDGYRLIIPDQRGFAGSDKPLGRDAYRMGTLMTDALAVTTDAGAGRFGVVGHDLGGAVAWALGAVSPASVAAMVVLASPHPKHFKRVAAASPDQVQRSFYAWLLNIGEKGERLLGRGDYEYLAQWAFAGSAVSEEKRLAYVAEWKQPGAFTAMAEWYRANYTPDLLNPEVPLDLPPVTVPVRYLGPERDAAFADGMHTGSGDFVEAPFDERTVAGTTHWMCHDQPEAVAALIDEWMTQHL